MGANFANDLADLADEGLFDIGMALRIHLTTNHYPPVPTVMVHVCEDAIDLVNEENYDALVTLPEGVLWRGRDEVPAHVVVEEFHLASFISVW
jgi:hypothetical protein